MARLPLSLATSIALLSSAPAWAGTITTYADRSSFDAAVGPVYLDTFDDLEFGAVPGNTIDRQGATYASIGKEGDIFQLQVVPRPFFDRPSDPNDRGLLSLKSEPFIDTTEFVVYFDEAVQGFAFDSFDFRSEVITIFFNDGTTSTHELAFDGDFNTLDLFGFKSSDEDIASVSFKGDRFFNAHITNFSFTVDEADVPEPTSLGLLGIGVLAAAVTRRRRRR